MPPKKEQSINGKAGSLSLLALDKSSMPVIHGQTPIKLNNAISLGSSLDESIAKADETNAHTSSASNVPHVHQIEPARIDVEHPSSIDGLIMRVELDNEFRRFVFLHPKGHFGINRDRCCYPRGDKLLADGGLLVRRCCSIDR